MAVIDALEVGAGDRRLTVPQGWVAVELRDDERPSNDLAAGVVESSDVARFAADVVLTRPLPVDVDAAELGVGQIVTDVRAGGATPRVVVGVGDVAGWATVTVHLWLDLDGEHLLLVATVPSERFTETWPAAGQAIASLLTVAEAIELDGVLW